MLAKVSSPLAYSTEKSVFTKPSRSSTVMLEIHWLSVSSRAAAPRAMPLTRTKSHPSTTQENGSCWRMPAVEESTTEYSSCCSKSMPMSDERGTVLDTRRARSLQELAARDSAVNPGPSCEKTLSSRPAISGLHVDATYAARFPPLE